MIIFSPSVQNVLDRLYVTSVTMGKQPVEYNRCIEAIRSAESGIIRTVAQKPLSWARARLFVAKAGRYWFGYVLQNNVVIIDEVFDCARNTIIYESINRKTITLTESDLRVMIQECLQEILKVYKKKVVDNKGGEWPDNMSDQDIEIQNDFIRRNRITDSSQLPTAWLDCLKHELC